MLDAFFSLLPLLVVGLLLWGIWSWRQGPNTSDLPEPPFSVRRVLTLLLLFGALLTAVNGATRLITLVADSATSEGALDTNGLASALSLLIVGVPATVALMLFVRRTMARDPDEQRGRSWSVYLNVVLAVSLMWGGWALGSLLQTLFGLDDLDVPAIGSLIVWATVWGLHWFWLKADHGIRGEVHLLFGSLVGFCALVLGLARVVEQSLDLLYSAAVDRAIYGEFLWASWMIPLLLGGAAWGWYWWVHLRNGHRQNSWHALVTILAIASFVTFVVEMGRSIYLVAEWVAGLAEDEAATHFDQLPESLTVLVVAGLFWRYYRRELFDHSGGSRTGAIRVYDYVMAWVALGVALGAIIGLFALLFELLTGGSLNDGDDQARAFLGVVIALVIGGALWWRYWSKVQRHLAEDRISELSSPVRRTYLVALFASGGLCAGIALIVLLFFSLEGLLEGDLGRERLLDLATPVAVILTLGLATWYHFRVFWAEREEVPKRVPPPPPSPMQATPPPPPGTQPAATTPLADASGRRQIVVVASTPDAVVAQLRFALDAVVTGWTRTDAVSAAVDVEQVQADLASHDDDVLVIAGPDGVSLIRCVLS